jgi:TonB family protein
MIKGRKNSMSDPVSARRFPAFIPSLWSRPAELLAERAEFWTRRMEAGMASVLIHILVLATALVLAGYRPVEPFAREGPAIFVGAAMVLPIEGDGGEGGGGGGGGKEEETPASGGTIPEAATVQYLPPDPGPPKPLLPAEEPLDLRATVQMPIHLPYDWTQPIGDITSPREGHSSSGPGRGGGIGPGDGTGIGPGNGPGVGPGARGGMGGGPDGGVGPSGGPGISGFSPPVILEDPKPPYTEEARKARTEGILVLSAIIRTDGRVDGIRIVKGLGYGLDESAIRTIAGKWRFRPAVSGGRPIECPVTIEVTFRLY